MVASSTGACCTVYKSAVWLFGGVADHDDGRAVIQSQFYNDLFVFDVPKRYAGIIMWCLVGALCF